MLRGTASTVFQPLWETYWGLQGAPQTAEGASIRPKRDTEEDEGSVWR